MNKYGFQGPKLHKSQNFDVQNNNIKIWLNKFGAD